MDGPSVQLSEYRYVRPGARGGLVAAATVAVAQGAKANIDVIRRRRGTILTAETGSSTLIVGSREEPSGQESFVRCQTWN
jgi:hypothetical protein